MGEQIKMASADLGPYLEYFDGYVSRFTGNTSYDQGMVEFKVQHTRDVLKESVGILKNCALTEKGAFLVQLSALFHDLGRFEQIERFGTFLDVRSMDHARNGVAILRKEGVLKRLEVRDRILVQTAILLHNRPLLPKNLKNASRIVAATLRDADKLANVPSTFQLFENSASKEKPSPLGLDPHPCLYTEQVLKDVEDGKVVSYADLRYVNDMKLAVMAWANDLNYSYTCRQFIERRYIERLTFLTPKESRIEAIADKIAFRLRKRYAQEDAVLNDTE